jgi:hypothetical protein
MSLLMTMLSSFFRDRTNIETFLGGPPNATQPAARKISVDFLVNVRVDVRVDLSRSAGAEGTGKLR